MPDEPKYGEPWSTADSGFLNGLRVVDKDGEFVLGYSSDEGHLSADDPRWRRIIACVNFCREMPTEQLEGFVFDGYMQEIRRG